VLWLDPVQRRYVEEVGAMNIFFVFGDVLATPRLSGSILAGVTRDSVMKLGASLGYKVEERDISIDEVIGGITTGSLTEIFGSGTAASISPVGMLKYQDRDYVINHRRVGPVAQRLFDHLTGLQYGDIEDTFGWIRKVETTVREPAKAVAAG